MNPRIEQLLADLKENLFARDILDTSFKKIKHELNQCVTAEIISMGLYKAQWNLTRKQNPIYTDSAIELYMQYCKTKTDIQEYLQQIKVDYLPIELNVILRSTAGYGNSLVITFQHTVNIKDFIRRNNLSVVDGFVHDEMRRLEQMRKDYLS